MMDTGKTQDQRIRELDLTEHRKLESQYAQAQKMEAVGQLTGEIAHDFNNLLTVISTQSGLLLAKLGPGDPSRRPLEAIQKATERAAALTHQLLAFSRQEVVDEPAATIEREQALAEQRGGSETILVVEDEEIVREAVVQVLEEKGYQILAAPHAEEALQICAKYPSSIDLIVTDQVMPGIHGTELAERLAVERPDMKLLLVSGYVGQGLEHLGEDSHFLAKPFTPEALTRKVREVLTLA